MLCDMVPPIGQSIARISPDRWVLGSSMVCGRIEDPGAKPANAIVSWQDGNHTLYLRERTPDDPSAGDSKVDRVHIGGSSAAVWRLGNNTFCKAKAWLEGLELEANNIQFVRERAPEVPVPEVIYSWVDRDLERSFLIMKRVPGQTLEQVWPRLSVPQRESIAQEVARFCVILAANTSSRFETVTGCGVYEAWLMGRPAPSHPSWKPRILGPFSAKALHDYMASVSTVPPPDIDESFHFGHADLGPANIMVSEDGLVTGIIDWELAAYFPQFWMATKPVSTWVFSLECVTDDPKLWGRLLGGALVARGYKQVEAVFSRWSMSTT